MRYAIIEGGIVANVIEAEAGFTIPGVVLVASDVAGPGWTYDGSAFYPPVPPPAPVPDSVSPLQARRALRNVGLLETVNDIVAAADDDTRDAWEYTIEVRRDSPILAELSTQLGMTSEQIDDLFRVAATL